MESINETLKVRVNKVTEEKLVNKKMDPKFNKLIKSLSLTDEEIKKNLSSFEDTLNELENCKKCPGLAKCKNHISGYVYYPQKGGSKVTFNYIPCKYLKKYEEDMENKDANMELLKARMKDIDVTDKSRVELIKWLKNFYDNYDITKTNKGLYLHGTFGSGKTFLIAALLNELKEKKKANYEIVYFPELLRLLKDNFNLLDSKVRYYSTVEILLIDDIGAEKVSDWGRDEILGTILQSRMNNHLTTFFTSNLNIEELEKHLSLSKDSQDIVKARRIIERVKQLTVDLELISINRRK
ncbi:MAG: primosomal protein DnaI [Firmicutes bacterium]|nr:primosomal protein DnaI [Bacillota bacterium]